MKGSSKTNRVESPVIIRDAEKTIQQTGRPARVHQVMPDFRAEETNGFSPLETQCQLDGVTTDVQTNLSLVDPSQTDDIKYIVSDTTRDRNGKLSPIVHKDVPKEPLKF